jgi:protein gp37
LSATKIEWATDTWNPVRARRTADGKVGWHCEKISAGCAHCYAETFNARRLPGGGTGLHYSQKLRHHVETFVDEKVLRQPLSWRKPRRVFVCSMTDLFGEWVTDEQIDRVFGVMACSRAHTYMVLTKRAERMREYMASRAKSARYWKAAARSVGYSLEFELDQGAPISLVPFPLPNVWLGVSVEDQAAADERIPVLLDTPAAVRFVSAEPLLGPINFTPHLSLPAGLREPSVDLYASNRDEAKDAKEHDSERCGRAGEVAAESQRREAAAVGAATNGGPSVGPLHWIIVGGESGPGARPCELAWIRSAVRQCVEAGGACFVKQLGAQPIEFWETEPWEPNANGPLVLRDRKGGDPSEWPADLRVRELPA